VVAEARTHTEALEATVRLRPDVVLLGQSTAHNEWLKILPIVARASRVLVLTHNRDAFSAMQVTRHGAAGRLVHGEFTVSDLIRAVTCGVSRPQSLRPAGGPSQPSPDARSRHHDAGSETRFRPRLSPRETEVMDLVAQGMANGEIALRLAVRQKTVKNHINRIFPKLGVKTRAQAIVLWLQRGSSQIVGRLTEPVMQPASA
jgi:DNA-binding NarL/FixJ family response regulator